MQYFPNDQKQITTVNKQSLSFQDTSGGVRTQEN